MRAVLGRVGLLTGFCLLLSILDDYLFEQIGYPLPALDQLGHVVLGTALGMVIVFRTNSSYSRFWDGRTCWGALINNARSLARLAAVYAGPAEPVSKLLTAYVVVLRETLRGSRNFDGLSKLIPAAIVQRASDANNPPTAIAVALSQWIGMRLKEGRIDSRQAMTMELVLNALVDNQGACERIQKTPLPFVYAALIKQILFIYLATLPFVLVAKMGFAAPLVVAAVSFGMLGIEEAGIEIENPFETEPNGLPLEQFCATVALDTTMICSTEQIA